MARINEPAKTESAALGKSSSSDGVMAAPRMSNLSRSKSLTSIDTLKPEKTEQSREKLVSGTQAILDSGPSISPKHIEKSSTLLRSMTVSSIDTVPVEVDTEGMKKMNTKIKEEKSAIL